MTAAAAEKTATQPTEDVRRVVAVIRGVPTSDGAGVKLTRVIGQRALPDLDPFLMLDEFGTDAPADYIDKMLGSIVGIELPIRTIQGKWKVSQNRAVADRLGVVAGLESQPGDGSAALAALVRERAR